ncbi:nuclear transport factor 2 family protein [Kibdelosporangium phytohabitans]|uniref:SnoaL-like domain-containing protein n=1 Tax=Kibdelosporangium phytohabitans TaxID=860235 RepID=A0A0N9I1D5_9PSEU|nr:nuclear transport factor 2 family protein [Kibdelosporangium phytohabitans]ALG08249.1 hypothetical protein AOZ06_16210 [Kibdelosporangium phytohabitans]MBE1470740.1 putative SnoaL-like aldol condensation-catalyzing enzyme [Kibdelosporangium phytohabitans]
MNVSELERNKTVVRAYLDMVFNRRQPVEAFAEHVGDAYVQHNPHAPDGIEASRDFLASLVGQSEHLSLEIKRIIAEGDLVVTHGLIKFGSGDRGSAFVDIMRLRDGKIVEHWDVVQAVPENPANDNSMF